MMDITPKLDVAYLRYAALTLRHHQLLSDDMDESEETERVEDELTELWDILDEVQRSSLSGLGSDLQWIRRNGELAPKARRPEEVSLEEWQTLNTVVKLQNWHAILHHLRVCGSRIQPDALALLRAEVWDELKQPEIAAPFHQFAQKVGGSATAILMDALAHECTPVS